MPTDNMEINSNIMMRALIQEVHISDHDDIRQQQIALLKLYIDATMKLGDIEHTGDWDPYTVIRINATGQRYLEEQYPKAMASRMFQEGCIYTAAGYPEITLGDFNDADQSDCMVNCGEITTIRVTVDHEEPEELQEYRHITIPIKFIQSIRTFE